MNDLLYKCNIPEISRQLDDINNNLVRIANSIENNKVSKIGKVVSYIDSIQKLYELLCLICERFPKVARMLIPIKMYLKMKYKI